MLFEQTIKCFKQYDSSKGCKRHPEQVSRVHYQGSQGVDTPSDLRGDRVHTNTTSVKEHHTSTDAPNQQMSEVTLNILESTQQASEKPIQPVTGPTQYTILGLPVVHLSLSLENPP